MRLFRLGRNKKKSPPPWTPAVEEVHAEGLYNEATEEEFEAAEKFCDDHPVQTPRLLPAYVVDRITAEGCAAWGLTAPTPAGFVGRVDSGLRKGNGGAHTVKVVTAQTCKRCCLLSDLPVMAGLYDARGKQGVYFEVRINKMNGIVGIGTACRPYPEWRFPGWNRLSAGLHLDDFRKFYEDPDGGRDYDGLGLLKRISPGDTIGCGYEFASTSLFFTYNDRRLSTAFRGVYLPREAFDVYAAIGIEGENDIEINFGEDMFRWKEGNDWTWKVAGQVGCFAGSESTSRYPDSELPKYE